MKPPCFVSFAPNEPAYCLRIEIDVLWAFPFSHLLHIHGTETQLALSFSTHEIVVKGQGLKVLWEGVANHRIQLLRAGEAEGDVKIEGLQVISADDLGATEESAEPILP